MNRPFETLEGVWGGIPLFKGSRVPAYFLVDFVENDDTLDYLIDDYEVDPACVEAMLLSPLPPQLRHAKSPV